MAHFSNDLFTFLGELARNNNREWFTRNKERYEDVVRGPALQFIADFAPHLAKISREFRAEPKKVGGSLFRIHRDTRFAKDKRPYKTAVGIQFRHAAGKDAHAPCFYLHLEPGECFIGAGIWHPDGDTTRSIREAIAESPAAWKKAAYGKLFLNRFRLGGDILRRPPRGFPADHPYVEDLKRKDFIAIADVAQSRTTRPGFMSDFVAHCKTSIPLQKFLCQAIGAGF
jgi:uncharacterized protein (TIGR02453 family)